MKLSILLTVLACNFTITFGYPGIVESNIDLKKFQREKNSEAISTKLPSRNSIVKQQDEKIEKFTTSSFQPLKFSREDVLNSIHPSTSYEPSTSSPQPLASGGVIFAISRGHESTSSPLIASADISEFSAGQPVLMQYLSPEGERKTAVSYIQLLRPIMMVPAQPYQPPQTLSMSMKPTATTLMSSPTRTTTMRPSSLSYTFFPRDDAPYASALTSDFISSSESPREYSNKQKNNHVHTRQQHESSESGDLDLNMHEYIPSASTQQQTFSSVPPPSFISQYSHYRASPQSAMIPQFRRFAQRA